MAGNCGKDRVEKVGARVTSQRPFNEKTAFVLESEFSKLILRLPFDEDL